MLFVRLSSTSPLRQLLQQIGADAMATHRFDGRIAVTRLGGRADRRTDGRTTAGLSADIHVVV